MLKDMREVYDPNAKWGWHSYLPMLESFGRVIFKYDVGDYQGDTLVFICDEETHRYGYLCFGWGSCSGCDALQGCTTIDELNELAAYLYNAITWHDSAAQLIFWIKSHDWEGDWTWCYNSDGDLTNFVAGAIEALSKEI